MGMVDTGRTILPCLSDSAVEIGRLLNIMLPFGRWFSLSMLTRDRSWNDLP
jgi:hypothetical protein